MAILCFVMLMTKPLLAQITDRTDSVNFNKLPAKSNQEFTFLKAIPGQYIGLEVDVLDNIYLLTAGNQLKKLSSNLDSIAVFNDVKKYGNPSLFDVSNPLKILVYYEGYSTAVILDRLLTLRNSINFRRKNIFSVQALSTSYDNNIWIFDEQDFKLKKLNDDGSVLSETTDLRTFLRPAPSPKTIIDREGFIYLYDPQQGFFIFDYYGSFKNNLPFKNWKHIAISGNTLYGFEDNKLFSYQLKSLQLKEYSLPSFFEEYTDIKAMNGKLYLLKKDLVEIYSVN